MSDEIEESFSSKILRVDLNEMKGLKEDIDSLTLRRYLGGCILGAKYLYDEVPFDAAWSDPENRLIILGGPLTGTAIPGSGGINVSTKGAMTGGAASSQANGVFGAYLRSCDLMGLVIQGACSKWTYIVVEEDAAVQFRSAEHLVGKDTWETVDAVVKELGKGERDVSVLTIGPAGENLVRFAAIVIDKGHVAAHNGVGAVLGSKKVKAIVVVRGKMKARVNDRQRVSEITKAIIKPLMENPASTYHYGTLLGVHKNLAVKNLPVKNYTTTTWSITEEKFSRFSGPYIRGNYSPKRRRPCWACPNHHGEVMTIPEGLHKNMEVEEPDYEQLAALGPNIGNDDITDVIFLTSLVDRLGFDVNETGWMLSCAMECYEKGILNSRMTDGIEMTWGNVGAVTKMLGKISRREGIGGILAEGVMRAVRKIGNGAEDIGIYTIKGATPRSHDHRHRLTELFDHCVSESGALDSTPHGVDVSAYNLQKSFNPFAFDPDSLVDCEVKMKGGMQLEDSMVTCRFITKMNPNLLVDAIQDSNRLGLHGCRSHAGWETRSELDEGV